MTTRPIVYDLTYVAARLHAPAPTGIERIDAAFARHYVGAAPARDHDAVALHYGLRGPHRLGAGAARRLVGRADAVWEPAGGAGNDPVAGAVASWLRHPPVPLRMAPARTTAPLGHRVARLRWRLTHDPRTVVPQGAVYLNVAQYAFEYPWFFRWLALRPDVRPVFFIHDLLPLDHPELFRAGYGALFARRVATMTRFAGAAIVSTAAVAERLTAEMERRGRPGLPLFTAPLPPPAMAHGAGGGAATPEPLAQPYFLMIGTIEPRKNHLLILQAWRDLAQAGGAVPRLVLVGPRGWENEQVVDLLERCEALRPHVAEVSGLSTPALRHLIAGATAVLLPSFAEGYGLPLAEALAAGTPVIASDIPVFREVSQNRALLLDPTDGPAWRRAILAYADPSRLQRAAALASARTYVAPTWGVYFKRLDAFLARLS